MVFTPPTDFLTYFRRAIQAKGKLEQQQLRNKTAAEETRKGLLELEAASKIVEAEGAAIAKARAESESSLIAARSKIASAEVCVFIKFTGWRRFGTVGCSFTRVVDNMLSWQAKAKAKRIFAETKLAQAKMKRQAQLEHERKVMEIEVAKAQKLADIEVQKFKTTVDALGAETIAEMARAGPEMQVGRG